MGRGRHGAAQPRLQQSQRSIHAQRFSGAHVLLTATAGAAAIAGVSFVNCCQGSLSAFRRAGPSVTTASSFASPICARRIRWLNRIRTVALRAQGDKDSDKPETPIRSDKASRETAIAWIDSSLSTPAGRALGRGVFLASSLEERNRRAKEGINTLSEFLEEAAAEAEADIAAVAEAEAAVVGGWGLDDEDQELDFPVIDLPLGQGAGGPWSKPGLDEEEEFEFDETPVQAVEDCVLLAVHFFAAQGRSWLGAESWPNAIMLQASVPGMDHEGVEDALRRDISPEVVSSEELREVVDAFVASTWGDSSRPGASRMMLIATPPPHAAIQYTSGVLFGYAVRGLVLRMSLDRQFGTSPETIASARKRLERQFACRPLAKPSGTAVCGDEDCVEREPTLMEYAIEFFGHRDWAALCRPADASVAVLEDELEDCLQGLNMLSGTDEEELREYPSMILGNENELPLDELTLLSQQEWESFERRAIALGALLADAEALADSRAGPPLVTRGTRPAAQWVAQLVGSGALSGVRHDQSQSVARTLNAPMQKVVQALRNVFLASKLKAARHGLMRQYASQATETKPEPRTDADSEVAEGDDGDA